MSLLPPSYRSALLFVLGLFGIIFIPVPGPYLEVWIMAYLLFVTEIVLMLSRETGGGFHFEYLFHDGDVFYLLPALAARRGQRFLEGIH